MTASRPLSQKMSAPGRAGRHRLRFSTPVGMSIVVATLMVVVALMLALSPRGVVTPPLAGATASATASDAVSPPAMTTYGSLPELTPPPYSHGTPSPSSTPSPRAFPSTDGSGGEWPEGDGWGAVGAGSPPPTPTPPRIWTGVRFNRYVEYFGWGPGSFRITDVQFWKDHYIASGTDDGIDGREAIFLVAGDGESWEVTDEQASDGAIPELVVGTRDRLLAVSLQGGANSGLWSSIDGLDWQTVDSPTWTSTWAASTPRAVAGGPAGYVAVGMSDSGTDVEAVVAYSSNARTWTLIDQPDVFRDASPQDVVWFPGGYAIGGTVADPTSPNGAALAVWISNDGSAWHRAEVDGATGEIGTIQLLVGEDGLALMSSQPVGYVGTQVTLTLASVDGSAWRPVVEPWKGTDMYGRRMIGKTAASDGTRMVVLGLSPEQAIGWVSADGTSWSKLTVDGGFWILGITSPPTPELLAVAPGGLLLWETNGPTSDGRWLMTFDGGTAVGD